MIGIYIENYVCIKFLAVVLARRPAIAFGYAKT